MPEVWNQLGSCGIPELASWWILCTARGDGRWTVELLHEVGMEGRSRHGVADLAADDGFAVYHLVAGLIAAVHGHRVAADYITALANTFVATDLGGLQVLDGPVSVPHHPHHPAA
jgi:hypothetical protein